MASFTSFGKKQLLFSWRFKIRPTPERVFSYKSRRERRSCFETQTMNFPGARGRSPVTFPGNTPTAPFAGRKSRTYTQGNAVNLGSAIITGRQLFADDSHGGEWSTHVMVPHDDGASEGAWGKRARLTPSRAFIRSRRPHNVILCARLGSVEWPIEESMPDPVCGTYIQEKVR